MNIQPHKILIVEDNALNRRLYRQLLRSQGFTTFESEGAREALALARTHRPDIILMDIQLPEVSGMEATQWLKADDELKSIPVIAVTAFAMDGERDAILAAGCDAHVSKPVGGQNLLAVIRSHLPPHT